MLLSYPAPELDDGVVRLRKWGMGDLECVRLAATDPSIPRGTTVPAQFSAAAGAAFVERQWSRLTGGEGVSLAVTTAGTALGLVTLLRHPKYGGTYEIGYWLIPDARGGGLAARAVRLASEWILGLAPVHRVEAHVDVVNTASRRTLENAGFQREGVLRSYLEFGGAVADAAVYSRVSSRPPGTAR